MDEQKSKPNSPGRRALLLLEWACRCARLPQHLTLFVLASIPHATGELYVELSIMTVVPTPSRISAYLLNQRCRDPCFRRTIRSH